MQLKKRARTMRIDRELEAAQVCGMHRIAQRLKEEARAKTTQYGECSTPGCPTPATHRLMVPTPQGIEIHALCPTCRRRAQTQLHQLGRAAFTTRAEADAAATERHWPRRIAVNP